MSERARVRSRLAIKRGLKLDPKERLERIEARRRKA